jgi:cell division protein FtsW
MSKRRNIVSDAETVVAQGILPSPRKSRLLGTADPVFFFVFFVLVVFGLVMVYSSSAVYAATQTGDSLYFLKRQMLWVMVGFLAFSLSMRIGYQRLVKYAYPMLLLTVILLILVLIPGIGSNVGGSSRWIRIGSVGIQPGEFAKVSFVIYLAYSLTRKKEKIRAFGGGFLPHLMICGILILLLLGQPDFGTAATLTLMLFFMLYLAGTKLRYLVVAALAALPMAYSMIIGSPYRMRRLLAFLDPWSHRYDIGYQITQSLIGFGSGGVYGVGLGEGKHKLGYTPAAHNDFIYSILGEELGMIGALGLLVLFGIFFWRGVRTALRAPDLFGTYLAFGLTVWIVLQMMINVGVVTGLLPTKGLTLPFISYGGSSIICTMFAAGILLNISAAAGENKQISEAQVTWP